MLDCSVRTLRKEPSLMSNNTAINPSSATLTLLDDASLELVAGGMNLDDQEPSVNVEDCRSGMCFNELTGWMDAPGTGEGSCYSGYEAAWGVPGASQDWIDAIPVAGA